MSSGADSHLRNPKEQMPSHNNGHQALNCTDLAGNVLQP